MVDLDKLIQLFNGDHDLEVEESAYQAIIKIGKPAVTPLIESLNIIGPNYWVFEALGELGEPRAIKHMIRHGSSWNHRGCVADAIGKIGPVGTEGIPFLIKLLGDEEIGIRKRAANALVEVGDERAIDPLCNQLYSDSYSVNKMAHEAITEFIRRKPIITQIQYLEEQYEHNFRLTAIEILGEVNDASAQELVIEALDKVLKESDGDFELHSDLRFYCESSIEKIKENPNSI